MALKTNPKIEDHVPGGKWYIMQYECNDQTSVTQVITYETSLVLALRKPDVSGAQKPQQTFFVWDGDVLRQAQIIYVATSHSEALEHLQQIKQLSFQKLFGSENRAMQPFIGHSMLLVQYNIGLENVTYSIVDMTRIVMFREHPQSVIKAFVRTDNEKLYPAMITRVSRNLNELIGALQMLQLSFSGSMHEAQYAPAGQASGSFETMQLQNSVPSIGDYVCHIDRKDTTPSTLISAQTKQYMQTPSSEGNETRVADQIKASSTKKARKYTKRARNYDPSHITVNNNYSAQLDKMLENMTKEQETLCKAFQVIAETRQILELRLDICQ